MALATALAIMIFQGVDLLSRSLTFVVPLLDVLYSYERTICSQVLYS